MSLLNDMLNDLQRKKSVQAASIHLPVSNEPLKQRTTNRVLALSAYVSMLSLMLVMIAYYRPWLMAHSFGRQSKTVARVEPVVIAPTTQERTINPVQVPAPVNAKPLEEPSNEPALLESMQQTENADEAILDDDLEDHAEAMTKKSVPLTPIEWHDDQLSMAMEALDEGHEKRAIRILTSILMQFPASIEVRETLAAIYLSQNALAQADDILRDGLKFDPRSVPLILMQARVLVTQGQHQSAYAVLDRIHPSMKKSPEYYALLAAVLEALGRSQEARGIYASLIKLDPKNGQYWLGLGVALEHTKATQQAITAYTRASQDLNSQVNVRTYAYNRLQRLQG